MPASSLAKPANLISATLLICDRILHEVDGVPSAIRIVDVFSVQEAESNLDIAVLVQLKAEPGDSSDHTIRFEIWAPGNQLILWDRSRTNIRFDYFDPNAPGGTNLDVNFRIPTSIMGPYRLQLFLDEGLVAQTSFTLRRPPNGPRA